MIRPVEQFVLKLEKNKINYMNNKVFFRHSKAVTEKDHARRTELKKKIAEAKAALKELESEYYNIPRYTFCAVIEPGKTVNHMRIGIARCSGKDQFTKKRGRVIAEGRAKVNPNMTTKIPLFITAEEEKEFNVGKLFYNTTEELLERLDNGYMKIVD
jgi:hypothetical protein